MTPKKILVPFDGSATSQRGLLEAIGLAKITGASIRVIHVVDELSFAIGASSFVAFSGDVWELLRSTGQEILDSAKADGERAGVPVDTVLRDSMAGTVCDQVTTEAAAWPADLIVIGTHGRRGVGRLLLGSDAEKIIRLANVPVLVVHADDRNQSSATVQPPQDAH